MSDLISLLLTDEGFNNLKEWKYLPEGERKQMRRISASIVGTLLKQLVDDSNIFLKGKGVPFRYRIWQEGNQEKQIEVSRVESRL